MTEIRLTNASGKELEVYTNGPVLGEINLIKYPFFILSKEGKKNLLQKIVSTEESLIFYEFEEDGVRRIWEVTPDARLGYPQPRDKQVFIAVLKLITDTEFPPPNPFPLGSLRSINRLLGNESGNTERIKEALLRIGATTIRTSAFFLRSNGSYWKEEELGGQFNLWDVYWKGEKLPNGKKAESVYLWFHPPFLTSLMAYYVKPLDYDYYLGLSPLAQRIYELASLKFFGLKDSSYIKYRYADLCQILPLTPQKYFSDAKRILDRAHKELLKTKFFKKVQWQGSSRKKPWYILYYPGERALKEIEFAKQKLKRFQFAQGQLKAPDRQASIELWAGDIYDALGDKTNMPYYRKLARLIVEGKIPEELVFQTLSETKYEHHEGRVENRSAYFTFHLKRRLKHQNIDLNALLKE